MAKQNKKHEKERDRQTDRQKEQMTASQKETENDGQRQRGRVSYQVIRLQCSVSHTVSPQNYPRETDSQRQQQKRSFGVC